MVSMVTEKASVTNICTTFWIFREILHTYCRKLLVTRNCLILRCDNSPTEHDNGGSTKGITDSFYISKNTGPLMQVLLEWHRIGEKSSGSLHIFNFFFLLLAIKKKLQASWLMRGKEEMVVAGCITVSFSLRRNNNLWRHLMDYLDWWKWLSWIQTKLIKKPYRPPPPKKKKTQ